MEGVTEGGREGEREREGRESVSYPVQRASSYEEKKKKWSRANVQNRYIIEDEADDNRKVASSRERKKKRKYCCCAVDTVGEGRRTKDGGCVMAWIVRIYR